MSSKNQRLNATITIGSVLEGSVKRNIGFLKSGLSQVGNSIKEVERRQKDLDRQRNVLRRQGQSVEHLDREYEKLERTLNDLRRAQERWNRAAAASRRVGSTFNTMASDIGRNVRRIAIGASLAGGAIFGIAASTAQLGDDVAKTADKLGIGIGELQELRYAAERSGVATSAFDTALEKMTKNIGLAMEGTGAQKDALDALGLSAANLATMSPEVALGVIADRLQGVKTQAEKAALANDLFGRSGIGMLNMLRDGSQGLTQLREDARRTGYVLSEQAARDAEVFQDTLLDTQLVMKGLKNTVGAELMPVVTQAMRRVGDTLVGNREEVRRWAEGFADGVGRALPLIGEVVTGIGQVGSVVRGVVEGTAEMVGGWENFGIVIGTVLASRTIVRVVKFGAAVFSLGKALFALARTTPLVVGGIRAIGAALLMNPIGLAVAAIAGGAALIYANWETVGPWFRGLWGDVKTYFRGFGNFVGGVFTGDMDRAASGIQTIWEGTKGILGRVMGGLGGTFRWSYDNLIKPVTDKLGVTGAIESAWSLFQGKIGAVLGGIGSVFSSTWSDLIKPAIDGMMGTDGIAGAWEVVKATLDPILTWIGDKFSAVMQYIQPVISALNWVQNKGAAAAQSLGNAFDKIGSGVTAPAGSSTRKDSRVRPQKNALGGPFGPGWHLTGELGPELKFENRSGYVANNRALRQLAGYADRVGSLMAQPRAPLLRSGAEMARGARVDALFAQAGGAAQTVPSANQVTQHITYTINAAGASAEDVIRLIERKNRQAAGNGLFDRAPATGLYGR